MAFSDVLDPILNPVMEGIPAPYNLLLMAFILTGVITLAYKFITDQNLMKSLKGEAKDLQKKMKEFKSDPDKAMEIQKKIMENTMKTMKQSLKPMLFTFLPIIFIFGWLRDYYEVNPGDVLFGLSWFWVYVIFSIILSVALRKLLKVH